MLIDLQPCAGKIGLESGLEDSILQYLLCSVKMMSHTPVFNHFVYPCYHLPHIIK